MALTLDACVAQHQGDRKEQQDRVALEAHPRHRGLVMAVLADGMGGHAGGALAAEQVVHTARSNFSACTAQPVASSDSKPMLQGTSPLDAICSTRAVISSQVEGTS